MNSIYLFGIASQRNTWLSVRQETITSNIAHANTPGYKARDVQPFAEVLQAVRPDMAASNPGHLRDASAYSGGDAVTNEAAWHTTESGNSVSIERELVKSGEVNAAFSLNNGVIKAFHRMLLTSTKV
jgi:flagellar basal-body rod protein FlgB